MHFPRSPIFVSVLMAVLVAGFCSNAPGKDTAKEPTSTKRPQPLKLAKLLGLLPDCPDEWVIKRSQAQTLYQENLEAYAMREYKEFTLPGVKRPKNAPKPETVVVVIRDTCGSGPHLEPFREETAPTLGGDFELGSWSRFPAMLVKMGKNRRSLRVLVADRFIVEVVFTGNNLRPLKWWFAHCDLNTLTKAKQETMTGSSTHITLSIMDELLPERTRSYTVPILPEKAILETGAPDPVKGKHLVVE